MRDKTWYSTRVKVDKVWEYIAQYATNNGRMPTHREIKTACHLSSTSVVNYYLWKLVEDGRLNKQVKGFTIRGARMIVPY